MRGLDVPALADWVAETGGVADFPGAESFDGAELITWDVDVLIVPDILANAGGVTVSYFEWVQNIQHFQWDEEKVNLELDKKMSRAYRSVREVATEHDIDMRTSAFVLAIRRVGRAALARIHIKTELPF